MNKVILMGRLVKDPEIRYTGGEHSTAVANYILAVPRTRKVDKDGIVDYFNCTVFGKGAEFAEQYLRKGIKILLSGRIQLGSYTNKEGRKVKTTDIIIEDQEFAESKKAAEAGLAQSETNVNLTESGVSGMDPDETNADEEGLPFR